MEALTHTPTGAHNNAAQALTAFEVKEQLHQHRRARGLGIKGAGRALATGAALRHLEAAGLVVVAEGRPDTAWRAVHR